MVVRRAGGAAGKGKDRGAARAERKPAPSITIEVNKTDAEGHVESARKTVSDFKEAARWLTAQAK